VLWRLSRLLRLGIDTQAIEPSSVSRPHIRQTISETLPNWQTRYGF
jgi:hypothetical protein